MEMRFFLSGCCAITPFRMTKRRAKREIATSPGRCFASKNRLAMIDKLIRDLLDDNREEKSQIRDGKLMQKSV
jgi:hypothetical protein